MRQLSPEEAELWARVTATIAPLSREKIRPQPADKEEKQVGPVATVKLVSRRPAPPIGPRRQQLGSTLDSTWDRRLRSGSIELDRIIDLHGMNLDQAWRAIDRGLEASIARGERVVLLITGHHRPGDAPVRRGRIRAAINDWLGASRHAGNIAAVRGAHSRHGGGGSLYIILRRR